jgi:transcriptional regulator with XRE-family HTH domain
MLLVSKKQIDPIFGQRLRALREAKGWSQTKLGNEAGVRYQYVARLERAESEPGWAMVLKLAEALGVTPDAFVSDADE